MALGAKLAAYTKYAMPMMTPGPGGLQPQPGLTANQPPPPGPTMPGQVPAGPGQPQPGGGAPMAAGAQPQQGAQPGAPPAQPPMTPPLPMNPRPPMPQMPMRPEVMAQTLAHVHQPTQMAPPRPARLADVRERPLDNFAAPTRHRLPLGPFHPTSVVQGCSTLFFRLVRPRRRLRLPYEHGLDIHGKRTDHSGSGWPGAPGGCWAFRRESFEVCGSLLDTCILGSGDHHMALGLVGIQREHPDT